MQRSCKRHGIVEATGAFEDPPRRKLSTDQLRQPSPVSDGLPPTRSRPCPPPDRLHYEHVFATVAPMLFEVDVTLPRELDDRTERFLNDVQRSANRVIRFRGSPGSITVTVEVAGLCREDALRAAAGEVARIFPASSDEKYGEPRVL